MAKKLKIIAAKKRLFLPSAMSTVFSVSKPEISGSNLAKKSKLLQWKKAIEKTRHERQQKFIATRNADQELYPKLTLISLYL